MALVTAIDVSKLFLAWSKKNGDLITNLKLQKLLYYAQAWHLVNFGKRLFSDPIEAWDFGPVVPDVYREYRKHGGAAIPYRPIGDEDSLFSDKQTKFLWQFFGTFNSLSATALVSMSHSEDPWKDNYVKGENRVIPTAEMATYYTKVYEDVCRKQRH